MLCLPLLPITADMLDLDESTSQDSHATNLAEEVDEEGCVGVSASLVATGIVSIDALHDFACEHFADEFFDLTVEIDESGQEDGQTWVNFWIAGELNAEGVAEFSDMALLASNPMAYYGLRSSDFI